MAIFLECDGIKGNVTADGYKDQIQLNSCRFSVSRGVSMEPGNVSNREVTRPALTEIAITKEADTSVISLFKESVSGDSGKKVIIHFARTGTAKMEEFMTYELENCIVSSYSISAESEGVPQEKLTLSYSKLIVKYKNTGESGKDGSQQVAGYSVTDGKPI
ncbi:MAG: type VI secretion system tube protein Hcp [Pseudomonadota bacterium]